MHLAAIRTKQIFKQIAVFGSFQDGKIWFQVLRFLVVAKLKHNIRQTILKK
jgi:hypothetical protein